MLHFSAVHRQGTLHKNLRAVNFNRPENGRGRDRKSYLMFLNLWTIARAKT